MVRRYFTSIATRWIGTLAIAFNSDFGHLGIVMNILNDGAALNTLIETYF